MQSRYFRVHIANVPTGDLDLLTEFCFAFEATGIDEALEYRQPDLVYDPELTPKSHHNINVYFNETPQKSFLSGLTEKFPEANAEIFEEKSKDWLAEWKKGFVAFSLSADYWVVPSWLPIPAQAKKPLMIDPGMAFGTGTHATTQLATDLLLAAPKKGFCLDVGTGTGILALVAEHEGFEKIVGLDIDPEARRTARENLERNRSHRISISDETIQSWNEPADLLIANIIDGVLLQLKEPLLRNVKPNGQILLSGILSERESEFLEAFTQNTSLQVVQRKAKDEWVAFRLQRSHS